MHALLISLIFSFFAMTAVADQQNFSVSPHSGNTIGISQIVEHPALNAVRAGMLESLAEEGFQPGKNMTVLYENAQGSIVTATQIANKLLSTPLNVIVAISTPSAQTMYNTALRVELKHKIPIVFSAVNDPKAAKLETGESNYPITGITDSPDLLAVVTLMRHMLPHLKNLGIIYNSSESNSFATVEHLKKITQAKLKVHEATVTSTAEVAQAMQSLVGKVDAVYFPQDNTIVSALETVVHYGEKIPLFCSDPLLIERGVLAAVGYDYHQVGRETGLVVAASLKGKDIREIPIHHPSQLKTVVNTPLAKKFKVILPKQYTAVVNIN